MPKRESLIPPIDNSEKLDAWSFYMAGWTPKAICEEAGINIGTLQGWMGKEGWYKQRLKIIKANRRKNPPEEKPMVKMILAEQGAYADKFAKHTGKIAAEDAEYWDEQMDPETRLEHAPNLAALSKMHRTNVGLDKDEPGERGAININFLNNPAAVKLLPVVEPKLIEDTE